MIRIVFCSTRLFIVPGLICWVFFAGWISLSNAAPIPENVSRDLGNPRFWPVPRQTVPDPLQYTPGRAETYYRSACSGPAGSMLILIQSNLLAQIESDMNDYIRLLESDGWTIELASWSGTFPEDLRTHLQTKYAAGINGAWFVGDLPIAYCMLPDDFGADAFPTDLYFMDLDGHWTDNDADGVFDWHTGLVQPEIWIGRLIASNLTATGQSEADLIRQYLAKAADYRINSPVSPMPAAVFADTGFGSDSYQGTEAVESLYIDCTRVITDDPQDYRDAIQEDRPWMSVYAHGSPAAHYFAGGTVTAVSLPGLGINTRFFTDFSCSNARYTAIDYMGGWYVFSQSKPLALIGSTKTGSLYYVPDLLDLPAAGRSFGEGLRHWSAMHSHQNPPWFYGVTLLGDPSLPLLRAPCVAGIAVSDTSSDADGIAEAGETVDIMLTIANASGWTFTGGASALMVSTAPELTLIDPGPHPLDSLAPGATGTTGPFTIQIQSGVQDGIRPNIFVDITWNGHTWRRPIHLAVAAPDLRPGHPFIDTDTGYLSPGDSAPIYLPVTNHGAGDVVDSELQIISRNAFLNFPEDIAFSVTLHPGDTEWIGPLQASLDTACPPGDLLPVAVRWSTDYPEDAVTLTAGGGICFDPGEGWNGLAHAPATPDTFDQWRREPAYFHCGRPDGLPYNSGMDAALILPEILVTGPAYLDIVHTMQAEPSWNDFAYDGGRVETVFGDTVEALIPDGGYSHRFELGVTAEYGSPCWAELPAGTQHRFLLPQRLVPYAIRFRFASDGGLAYDGWKIESIRISGEVFIPEPDTSPGPFPPCDRTGVRLAMPATAFRPGDICGLDAQICNMTGATLSRIPVFFLLEIDGTFWFWPSWSPMDYQRMQLEPGETRITVVEPFVWPYGAGNRDNLYFYGAVLNETTSAILGDWDRVGFSFWEN